MSIFAACFCLFIKLVKITLMKKLMLFSVIAMSLAMTGQAQVLQDNAGLKAKGIISMQSCILRGEPSKVTAQELLGCSNGTVFGGEYDGGDDTWTGFASSDEGRKDAATSVYQYFSDCYYKFDGVRFLGLFNYYSAEAGWHYCTERGGIDENGEMTKPITVKVAFYEENVDGKPGKEIYSKVVDVVGERTGVKRGDENQGYSEIYSFRVDLGEELKMNHGFMQISAVDTHDETVDCYLALFTASSSPDYALMKIDKRDGSEPNWNTQQSCCYCFYGNGELIAEKALKFDRILSPSSSDAGKYGKVQVELTNIGSSDIDDITLQLWQDNRLVSTEKVKNTVKSMESFKYTFRSRVDCSAAGTHEIVIKNVTPDCENISIDSISKEIVKSDGIIVYPESRSTNGYFYISNVKIGDIDNTSGASDYTDYSNLKTSIQPGNTLSLQVTASKKSAEIGAWIDWNGNGSFDDDGETLSFTGNTAQVRIPENANISVGDKRLRIVISYDTPLPVGVYTYGETEDYTVAVENAEGAPLATVSSDYVVLKSSNDKQNVSLGLSNKGDGILMVDVKYDYVLPNAPTSDYSICKSGANPALKGRFVSSGLKKAVENPERKDNTEYVLKYDKGKYDVIGITNSPTAIYANYFPGDMLASLSGMELSSVDVFVATPSKNNSIVVYGEGTQNVNGETLVEQQFSPIKNSWNHIVLDTPVKISDKDLWIGYKATGMENVQYSIGYDKGKAVSGFGDRVNIDGDTWWAMSDLGMDYNYCIRGNVTGERTPAISWLSVDSGNIEIGVGDNISLNVAVDASKLDNALYEAKIEITTNDNLRSVIEIPVYVENGITLGIIDRKYTGGSTIKFSRNALDINGEKEISTVLLTDMSGKIFKKVKVNNMSYTIPLSSVTASLYVVKVIYSDGTSSSVKIPVFK